MNESKFDSDLVLREMVAAIVAADAAAVARMLTGSPHLSTASFQAGATRSAAKESFIDAVKRYIVVGDTALHFAAAAYQTEIARMLLAAGADVHARNRFGYQPLHAAAAGGPGSSFWSPVAQAAAIALLIETGADPNATDKRGVTPLHIAVRTRCAMAVRILLELGANPSLTNKNGSTPMLLAHHNTGRGGSGSPEAKAQQQEIVELREKLVDDQRVRGA
jgi:ankyrin repeat protein